MSENTSLLVFPCDFPLKIIGINSPDFKTNIETIVRKHFDNTKDDDFSYKSSLKDNYLAITVTVHVQDKPSLDALYQELTQHPSIKMVL